MDTSLFLGFAFILLGAICNGTFAVPHKFVKGFAWENTWGSFFFFTQLIVPGIVASLFLKGANGSWGHVSAFHVAAPIAFGFLWGCGGIMFGTGISMIGLSLGYSVTMGLCALLGSLTPLLTQHIDQVFTPAGIVIISGIVVSVAGVAVCGFAGMLRERSQAPEGQEDKPKGRNMAKGLLICVLAGTFSACCNLAFSYGDAIKVISETRFHNAPWIATLSVWLLVFWGGFLATGSYCTYKLFRNSTWRNFTGRNAGYNFGLTAIMAILHFAILLLYGLGAHYLGKLGTSVGWAVNMSSALIVANAMGFITAEWRRTSKRSRNWIYAGLMVLIFGITVLGIGNNLQ